MTILYYPQSIAYLTGLYKNFKGIADSFYRMAIVSAGRRGFKVECQSSMESQQPRQFYYYEYIPKKWSNVHNSGVSAFNMLIKGG